MLRSATWDWGCPGKCYGALRGSGGVLAIDTFVINKTARLAVDIMLTALIAMPLLPNISTEF